MQITEEKIVQDFYNVNCVPWLFCADGIYQAIRWYYLEDLMPMYSLTTVQKIDIMDILT